MGAKLVIKNRSNLLDNLKSVESLYAKVGLLAETARGSRQSEDDEGNKSGLTVAEIGVCNEYGTRKIPARPFVRPAFESAKDEIVREATEVITRLVTSDGKSAQKALAVGTNFIGAKMASKIKEKIRSNVPPPNAPSTMLRKILKGKGVKAAEMRVYRAIGSANREYTLGFGRQGPMTHSQMAAETWRRVARLANAEKKYAETLAGSAANVKTLIDTGRMLNAVTWVLKRKGEE